MNLRLFAGLLALVGGILVVSHSPDARALEPSKCTPRTLIYADGSQKRALGPPTPSGTLTRLENRRFRFVWRFESLPAQCRPITIGLGLRLAPPGTIVPFKRPIKAKSGTYTTIPIPAVIASKVIYGQLWAEGATGLLSDDRRVPVR